MDTTELAAFQKQESSSSCCWLVLGGYGTSPMVFGKCSDRATDTYTHTENATSQFDSCYKSPPQFLALVDGAHFSYARHKQGDHRRGNHLPNFTNKKKPVSLLPLSKLPCQIWKR